MSKRGITGARTSIANFMAIPAVTAVVAFMFDRCNQTHIFEAAQQISLQQTFDALATDNYVMSKAAWLDVVERGYPKRDSTGEQKSPSQLEFETTSHARYQLLEALLANRCPSGETQEPMVALRCANYRVFALYDATEEGAETVFDEACRHVDRLASMQELCGGFDDLLGMPTSDRKDPELKPRFNREHEGLGRAMANAREALRTPCSEPRESSNIESLTTRSEVEDHCEAIRGMQSTPLGGL